MEGMIGEIRLFAGNFAPRDWAFCAGQDLQIAMNSALFSILGTTYGGDGRNYFKLPDFRGRAATHQGTGPGLDPHYLGRSYGYETVSLNLTNLPLHNHPGEATYVGRADGAYGTTSNPANAYLAKARNNAGDLNIYDIDPDPADRFNMGAETMTVTKDVDNTGGNGPVDIMGPSLTLNFIICIQGFYPSRS